MFGLEPLELLVLMILGVLLFGRDLPNVGRYFRKSLKEFRKGMDDNDNFPGGPPMAAA